MHLTSTILLTQSQLSLPECTITAAELFGAAKCYQSSGTAFLRSLLEGTQRCSEVLHV